LTPDEWWRIVNFDLSNDDNIVDWTHEREWRLTGDAFQFDISKATIILPNSRIYKHFIKNAIRTF
jgi:hypothetical protein